MPGSSTTPGRSDLAIVRPKRVAFRVRNSVGTRGLAFAAQWLAYALPYRRFVSVLTDANARLGADVDRYSFIVVDLHHLLLAGLPAHFESHMPSHAVGLCRCGPCLPTSTDPDWDEDRLAAATRLNNRESTISIGSGSGQLRPVVGNVASDETCTVTTSCCAGAASGHATAAPPSATAISAVRW